jgi:acyl carrier protein
MSMTDSRDAVKPVAPHQATCSGVTAGGEAPSSAQRKHSGTTVLTDQNTTQSGVSESERESERELAQLIVQCLNLEDVAAEDIQPEERLFGEGLGLDSLDMLELSMAIERRYGVSLRSDDPDNPKIFASLRSLNQHIQQRRGT